ncbi:sulfatase-like hydrolase/transferase [Opitutales bacterium]|nr:sulfatase-like hydrolase/transferase [Opitutales bacterium]
MKKRAYGLCIGLLLLGSTLFSAGTSKPNVLLILADDVGCEPIGCYGGESFATPNIDALARNGMKFEHCYSMPVCHPSRIALMTGRYPFRFKAGWGSFPKNEEKRSIGQVMKEADYATAVAGKWQMTLLKKDPEQPSRLGFEAWSVFGWHEGARFHSPMIYQNGKVRKGLENRYGPELYVEFLTSFMEESKRRNKPFFAYYSMALAHDVTDDLKRQVPYAPGKDRWMNYGEMITSMDEMVGKLLASLDRLKLRENTLVLFTGDNGTAARSKLRHLGKSGKKYEYEKVVVRQNGRNVPGGKGLLNDRGTHVPLIANWPMRIAPGSVSEDLVDFSDWLPTIAEIGRAELPKDVKFDGQSFASSFLGKNESARGFAFAESRGGRAFVRDQRYKLYANGKFYDISIDPEERKSLAKGEATEIRQRLENAIREIGYGK